MTLRLSSFILVMLMTSLASAQEPLQRLSLDGEWDFTADSGKVGLDRQWYLDSTDRSSWQRVKTPDYWEGYPGLATYDGWGWFARRVHISTIGAPLSIHFAGVDDEATVWVNGAEIGSHSGYTDPFALDLKGTLREGENTIVVLVKDHGGGGGIYRPVTLIETRRLDDLLRSHYSAKPAVRSTDWVKDAVIYSVYLRSFSPEGTFAGLERRLPELKSLGVTVLWLLPINPVGVKNRKGRLGSPYAVRDYYGINPEFGTLEDFKRLLAATHKQGMKLIIDLVANHTSWDSKLIVEHPDWFTTDTRGQIVSPNADWTDVADLDYSKPGLRTYMAAMMRWWVKDVGIDGFRCDVAELVPIDFWEAVREQLNKVKPVMMLSEGSAPEHHVKAFDLTYSWNMYDALAPLIQGKRPVALIDQILKTEQLQFPAGSLRMRFVTNHDKNAWDAPAVLKFGHDGLKLAIVLTNTLPGVPMIYTGEEVANDRRLDLFEKIGVDWNRPREMEQLYRMMFRLRKEHLALSRGEMIRVPASDADKVYAFLRSAGNDKILTVLNFSDSTTVVDVTMPFAKVFPGKKSLALTEAILGQQEIAAVDNGGMVKLTLEPRGYRVFVVE